MKPSRTGLSGLPSFPTPLGSAILKRTIKILLSLAFLALIAWSLRDQNPWEVIRRLDPAYAAWIALQTSRCLSYAHQQGVIHRDLKPENIFVIPGPTPAEDTV